MDHVGRSLKNPILLLRLRTPKDRMTKALQMWSPGQGGEGRKPESLLSPLLSLFIKPGILSNGFSSNLKKPLGGWCDFWLRLLCMCRNKKEGEGEKERETTNLRGTPCPTARRAWWQTKPLIVSSSTQGPGKLEHRGVAVTHLAQAALALHISTCSMVKHLGHLLSAALFFEIYDVYQVWQLANW